MKQKRHLRDMGTLVMGMALGAVLCVSVSAAAKILAEPSQNTIYVDGQKVDMEAYKILGSNYLQLREVGEAVGFNVYWDGVNKCVQVDTASGYTGAAPEGKTPPNTAPVTTPTATPSTPKQETASDTVDVEAAKDEMIRLTNDLRRENGVAELAKDDLLMQAAQVRAEEMAATGTYSHTRPNGKEYYTVTDVPYMNENINCILLSAIEQQRVSLADATMEGWIKSDAHVKNLLNQEVYSLGVGIAKGTYQSGHECWYICQLFVYDDYTITWVDKPQK